MHRSSISTDHTLPYSVNFHEMTSNESQQSLNTEELFHIFNSYFNEKFEDLHANTADDEAVKVLKNSLEAKELSRQGNSAQFQFCGKLEIALDKIKVSLLKRGDIQEAIDAIQTAEELVAERKKKIKIADGSEADWTTVQHLGKRRVTCRPNLRRKKENPSSRRFRSKGDRC